MVTIFFGITSIFHAQKSLHSFLVYAKLEQYTIKYENLCSFTYDWAIIIWRYQYCKRKFSVNVYVENVIVLDNIMFSTHLPITNLWYLE